MTELENADLTNPLHKRCKIHTGYYDPAKISLADPEKERWIYGNNTLNQGRGGQAIIRHCPQSFGIVTKRFPSTTKENAFFTDSEADWKLIEADLIALRTLMEKSPELIVYFPKDGIGTGLSQMPKRCPKLYKKMTDWIWENFGIDFRKPHYVTIDEYVLQGLIETVKDTTDLEGVYNNKLGTFHSWEEIQTYLTNLE